MSVSLADKKVLVIGASSGMGRATAVIFAKQGARVMAAARREDRLRALQKELQSAGSALGIQKADASVPEDMERLARNSIAKLGGIDILVFATGTNTPDRAMTRLTPKIWDMMVNVNLNAAYYATYAVLPTT